LVSSLLQKGQCTVTNRGAPRDQRCGAYTGKRRQSAVTAVRTWSIAASEPSASRMSAIQSATCTTFGLFEAARGGRRRTDADAARDHRRSRIVRDGIFVDRQMRSAECRIGVFAGDVLVGEIDQEQVVVGAAETMR
jgi:hypothetical protein